MDIINQILQKAKLRATQNNLTYAGAFTPYEAFDVLQNNPNAV